jgi:hypothetical protein
VRRTTVATTAAAVLGAAAIVFVAALLPPRARPLLPPGWQPASPEVMGVYHVHTTRSDGTGTVDEVAAAAARAGLRFVVFTDHGHATRQPDPPSYRSGVLCIDAVEISTRNGHYAALGMGRAPYPLGGDAAGVVEDVRRLGGMGIVAHPDSPKPELRWTGGDTSPDGMEWLNADSEWRDESAARLAVALLTYPFRGAETVASLFRRPASLARWDAAQRARFAASGPASLVGVAGADAHAKAGWKTAGDPSEGGAFIRLPSYESTFRAFSLRVLLDRALTGRAGEDATLVLGAIRSGHLHTIIDAYARPGVFEFTGRTDQEPAVREGDRVALTNVLVLRARCNAPAGSRLVLMRDGREVNRATASELVYATNRPGTYRVEAWLPGGVEPPMPWVVSNAITAVSPTTPDVSQAPGADSTPGGRTVLADAASRLVVATLDAGIGWAVEREPNSSGQVAVEDGGASLTYTLGSAAKGSQYAALAHPLALPADAFAIAFRGTSDAPIRLSVQVRVPSRREGERWERSVYLDREPREIVVPIADMQPIGPVSSPRPRIDVVDSLLLVVDREHATPGSSGAFQVRDVRILGARR